MNKTPHNTSKRKQIVTFEAVRDKIIEIRGQHVILDYNVAELYGVETREINQAVKNNPNKFPKGWLFELNNQESAALRSKILMLEEVGGKGRYSKRNYKAFTERGLYIYAGNNPERRQGCGNNNRHRRHLRQTTRTVKHPR